MANQLGKWAFIIGAVLAIVMGIGVGLGQAWGSNAWLVLLLVILGLVVGFVNISMKEVQGFLIAALALLVANTANLARLDTLVPQLGGILAGIIANVFGKISFSIPLNLLIFYRIII